MRSCRLASCCLACSRAFLAASSCWPIEARRRSIPSLLMLSSFSDSSRRACSPSLFCRASSAPLCTVHAWLTSSSSALRRSRRLRTSLASISVSSSSCSLRCCSFLSTPLCSSALVSAASAEPWHCSSGMMTHEQYSQIKSETGMKGVTSMSDCRITPECMHTALQSSNCPEPASKNISCDLWSRSIMCCVLSNERFFSWQSCCASESLACCLARRTEATPSDMASAYRIITS
mmetsp:Transcript_21874/g.44181  ORF Transcript_21874/g.44181 Transcript_21874/m.44181 type:complete len:233 (+) Transcript_21874:887-1585(+)